MRLYKLVQDVEFPEKSEFGYINIRSTERIDVRPNETRMVSTGFRVSKLSDETITVRSIWGDTQSIEISGETLYVKVTNHADTNIMIYVGMVIGEILVEKQNVK